MYLEALEIHGFKSFGRKTKFKFTDGITSIVGPNGCGKSNIVDAIRWVLGEQKAGIIRSERMENVIFNGSKNMKPLGMAEASLVIHNTKNVLPIEYSEIMITRRLYRSGESQYLLNNSTCRLKDIQDLFMDTGMGADAYSIIELSMVESILNGRAEERRRIFEEAAGVTKYKLRRRAAFRKLEATEGDLQRLNDIISEVEKNVASLKRQVRKAQRYQEFKNQLKEKDLQLASYQFSQLSKELEPLSRQLKEAQDQRVAISAEFDERESEIEQARLELLETENKLSAKQRDLNELNLRIQKKEEEILVDRERRKALESTKLRLDRDREETQQRVARLQAEVEQTTESLQNLFERIQVAESDFQEKSLALKTLERNVHDKTEQRKAIEVQRLKFLEGISVGKQEEERFKTQLENIRNRCDAIDRELEENKLLEDVRQSKIEKLSSDKSETDAQLRNIGEEHARTREEIETLSQKKETLKESILNRRSELQTIQERIELLKKFIESYEDHPEGVQHLLLQGHLNGGCKGTLGEILSVDSTYRQAIETALGEAAVSLIVEETDQALRCIEVLKSESKGPVTFFPLDRFAKRKMSQPELDLAKLKNGSDGIIDWAYNLVTCSHDFQPMIRSLLRDYIVVSDLNVATKYVRNFRNRRLYFITLNGEIVSSWGPIKGGAGGTASSGIVGRKALVEELEKKSKEQFQQLEKEELERDFLEERYRELIEREKQTAEALKRNESQQKELEIQLAQLQFEAKKEEEVRARIKKEKAELSQTQSELHEKIEAMAPSLTDMAESRTKFDDQFDQVSEELLRLEHELDEYRVVVQDSRVTLVDLKGEERRLQEDIARKQEFERELKQSLSRIKEEMVSNSSESVALEKRIEENKRLIQGEFDKHNDLQSEVQKIEQEYFGEKEKLDAKERSVKDIRIEKDEIAENLHSMELRVSELKMERNKIAERTREEYGVELENEPAEESLETEPLIEEISKLKQRITAMEPVNLLALKEYDKEKARFDFLSEQKNDLLEAEGNLQETIRVINKTARDQFTETFVKIQENFKKVFAGFFPSGQANLQLATNADPLEAEIIIEADPKGRRISSLSLLSGGEKALTAISLLFAIYLVKPSPFCILDEVDAPLDDANIGRFTKAIRNFATDTQFIIVTHNKLTMRSADCLYGVTMEEEGVSKVVSVNFTEMDLGDQAPKAA